MSRDMEDRRAREAGMVAFMIGLYCRAHHGTDKGALCPDCAALADYARTRSARCPRMAEKTFCSTCPHPCYAPAMREGIRQVMRWAGPRMLLYHPVWALRHIANTLRHKLNQTGRSEENP